MRELLKSFSSLSLALMLLPIKQMENALAPRGPDESRGPSVKTMDAITNTILDQYGGTLRATFSALDNVQRGAIEMGLALAWPFPGSSRPQRERDASSRRKASRASAASRLTPTGEDSTSQSPARSQSRSGSHHPQLVTQLESMRRR